MLVGIKYIAMKKSKPKLVSQGWEHFFPSLKPFVWCKVRGANYYRFWVFGWMFHYKSDGFSEFE